MSLEGLQNAIQKSRNIVCLLGVNASQDCGCLNYRWGDRIYELESRYGQSPEEIFSAVFYNTRTKQFFDFYQKEILSTLGTPDACMHTLARMEQDGKLNAVITREIFSLAKRAGCKNVLELHGSIYRNKCPHCGKEYDIEYMKKGKTVPLCEKCGVTVRPQVCLVGEVIDNQILTAAANEIQKADLLLILGCNMNAMLTTTCVKYFNGDRMVLINEKEHYKDDVADMVYHAKPRDILPKVYPL